MRTLGTVCTLLWIAGSVCAADPKEEVQSAAKLLGEKNSYSWKSTVNSLIQSRFRQGPTEGKTEKGGFTSLTMSFGEKELTAIAAAVAGGLIAFYQIGYGIAAFGVGPLHTWAGLGLNAIYGGTALVALVMAALSFVVVRRQTAPALRGRYEPT